MLPEQRIFRKPVIIRRQELSGLSKDHDTLMIGDCNVGTWEQEVYCAHRLFQVATGLDDMEKTQFKRPSGWTGKRMIVIAGTFDIIRGDPRGKIGTDPIFVGSPSSLSLVADLSCQQPCFVRRCSPISRQMQQSPMGALRACMT
jgi:hypothetical protein